MVLRCITEGCSSLRTARATYSKSSKIDNSWRQYRTKFGWSGAKTEFVHVSANCCVPFDPRELLRFLQTANLCEHLLLFTLVREGAEKTLYPESHYIPAAAPI